MHRSMIENITANLDCTTRIQQRDFIVTHGNTKEAGTKQSN